MPKIKEEHNEEYVDNLVYDEFVDDAHVSDCNTINRKLIKAKPDHYVDDMRKVEDTDSNVESEIDEYNGSDHNDEGNESLHDYEEYQPELMHSNVLLFGNLIFLGSEKRVHNSYNRRYIEPVIKDKKDAIIVVSEVIVDTPSLRVND